MFYVSLKTRITILNCESGHSTFSQNIHLSLLTKIYKRKIRGGEITLPPDLDKVSDIGSGRYVEVPLSSFISVRCGLKTSH